MRLGKADLPAESKWTILGTAPADEYRHKRWLAECVCGRQEYVLEFALKNGRSTQCVACGHDATIAKRRETFAFRGAKLAPQRKRPSESKVKAGRCKMCWVSHKKEAPCFSTIKVMA